MPDFLPYLICAIAYGAQAVVFWPGRSVSARPGYWRLMPLLPLFLHLWLVFAAILGGGGVALSFSAMLSAITALTVLVYGIACWRYPVGGVQGVVLAIAAFAVIFQGLMGGGHTLPYSSLPWFRLHLLMALTAYSLFLIAALHALFIAVMEKALHRPTPGTMTSGLPPLLTLEHLLFRMIEAGFILLTLTLVSGVFFAEDITGRPLPFTHMTVFGVASWLVFAGLLVGRHRYGWRGRRAIHWTLAGFAMLFLSYMGSQFVLEFLLHRG